MSWSFRLGRVRGIDIRVHYTFLFLMAVVVIVGGGRSPAAFLSLVAGLVLLFTCVVLHELGHSVVAQAHGIRVRDITLLPIGGIARLEEVPEEPWTELKIATRMMMLAMITSILTTVHRIRAYERCGTALSANGIATGRGRSARGARPEDRAPFSAETPMAVM